MDQYHCEECGCEIDVSSVDWGVCEICGRELCNSCAGGWDNDVCSDCQSRGSSGV